MAGGNEGNKQRRKGKKQFQFMLEILMCSTTSVIQIMRMWY